MRFAGRVVAITGGSGGIGLATAQRLVSEGARVAILDLDAEAVKMRAEELSAQGTGAVGLVADTTDEPAMTQAFSRIADQFGSVDGLVTAAGVRQTSQPALELDLDTWETVQAVNVTGTFIACRAAARAMVAAGRGGAIVTIASVIGAVARMGQAAYGPSKAAVLHLTKVLALEWAGDGIRVNAVCPGATETPMIRKAVTDEGPQALSDKIEGSLAGYRPGIPLRRLAQPEEQASAITFLLSADASFVTGAALFVDGGVAPL